MHYVILWSSLWLLRVIENCCVHRRQTTSDVDGKRASEGKSCADSVCLEGSRTLGTDLSAADDKGLRS